MQYNTQFSENYSLKDKIHAIDQDIKNIQLGHRI